MSKARDKRAKHGRLVEDIDLCAEGAERIAARAPAGYRHVSPLVPEREVCLYFLGVGGGDAIHRTPVVGGQIADIGGFGIKSPWGHILVDPGPDCVRELLELAVDARDLDAVIISHRHVDHYADWEFVVARMTGKGPVVLEQDIEPTGCLLATEAFLQGNRDVPAVASEFYLSRLRRTETLVPGSSVHRIRETTVYARIGHHRESKHIDTVPSLDILTGSYYLVYLGDGEYQEDIVAERLSQPYYRSPDVVIANVQTLNIGAQSPDAFTPNHLGLRGTLEVLRRLHPRVAVLRSWGLETFVEEDGDTLRPAPWKLDLYAQYVQEVTGVPVIVPGTTVLEIDKRGFEARHVRPPVHT